MTMETLILSGLIGLKIDSVILLKDESEFIRN